MNYINKIDKKTLFSILTLCLFGVFIMFSVSPAIAYRINIAKFQIALKHVAFLFVALAIMFKVSTLKDNEILRLSMFSYIILILMLILVLFFGPDIKGAKRWIKIPFLMALQPSEILKPFFIVINAMFLRNLNTRVLFKVSVSLGSFILIGSLLIKEPDFGMFCIYAAVWISQLFIAGFNIKHMMQILASFLVAIVLLISVLPHAKQRILSFTDKSSEPKYQVEKALQSMIEGGDLGKGPGDGTIKFQLPDVYTDYIFSAIGEEFGYIICFIITCLYIFIVIHNLLLAKMESDLMKANIISGIIIMFGLQSFINIGVNINLLPSKGMTLPFISYGGSAIVSMGICFGILFSITNRKNEFKSRYNLY